MRGQDAEQGGMWSYIQPERRVAQDHPLRSIRGMVDQALKGLSPGFALLYSHTGRPSIPPEQLLRALLLQAFYSIRSERQLMEQLDYNFLFRWFVGLSMDDPIWDVTVFTKNRDRLLQGDVARPSLKRDRPSPAHGLPSAEHFTVDVTLLEAWASHKCVRPKAHPTPRPPRIRGTPRRLPRRDPEQRHPPVHDRPGRPAGPEEARGRRRSWATGAMFSWRTARASWSGRRRRGWSARPSPPLASPWPPRFRATTA